MTLIALMEGAQRYSPSGADSARGGEHRTGHGTDAGRLHFWMAKSQYDSRKRRSRWTLNTVTTPGLKRARERPPGKATTDGGTGVPGARPGHTILSTGTRRPLTSPYTRNPDSNTLAVTCCSCCCLGNKSWGGSGAHALRPHRPQQPSQVSGEEGP